MKHWLDYVYYRIRKWNYKYDNGEGLFAAGAIGLIEGILLLDVYILATYFLFSHDHLNKYTAVFDWTIAIAISFITMYNCYAYRDQQKFAEFDNKWKNESHRERRLKGWLVFITLLAPWFLLYFINEFSNPN